MAVHYKFKSAKDFDLISIEGHFITVGHLKDKIFESKQLVVINAHTNEEYLDEATLIPKNSSLLVRRLPALPHKPIVTAPVQEVLLVVKSAMDRLALQVVEDRHESASKTSFLGVGQSVTNKDNVDELDDDQFGNDPYDIPQVAPVISINPPNKAEDRKIQALTNTPALDCKQTLDGFGSGRGFGHGMGGRRAGPGYRPGEWLPWAAKAQRASPAMYPYSFAIEQTKNFTWIGSQTRSLDSEMLGYAPQMCSILPYLSN